MRLGSDIAYALRSMARNRGFTAVAVLSLALGIAANSTMFSIVNTMLLGDLPVREPHKLVTVVRDDNFTMSYPEYEDCLQSGVFEAVAARFPLVPVSLASTGGAAERVWGQVVTASYFDVVGASIPLGRGFRPAEDEVADRDAVVVLSHDLWKLRFSADPGIIGRTVILNQIHFTVIGVAQPGFRGTDRLLNSQFWAPLRMSGALLPEMKDGQRYTQRDSSWLTIDARLKGNVSRREAISVIQAIAARVDRDQHRQRPRILSLEPGGKWPGKAGAVLRMFLAIMMAVVGLVLAIACANVANLLLAKASARRKEFSLRLAVGASRSHLIQQLLTESVLLSLCGAVIGWMIAFGATRLLTQVSLPLPIPIEFDFTPDLRVFAFTTSVALTTGILFGLAPALRASNSDLISSIREGGSSFRQNRWFSLRNALVVVQVTLSLVLLATATLFLRSLSNATRIDLGIQPQGVLAVSFDPNQHSPDIEKRRQFLAQLLRGVEALPSVESAAYVDILPLSIGGSRSTTHSGPLRADPTYFQVSRGYLKTLGIPLLRGADFAASTKGTPVVIIDEVLAGRLFPNAEALGSKIRRGSTEYTVIGIAREAKARTIGETAGGVVYTHLDQTLDQVSGFLGLTLVLKTTVLPKSLAPAIHKQIAALDPNLAVFKTETMEAHVSKAFLLPQMAANLFGIFGTVGLTLAAIGLFGVLSFTVRQRIREIGIRMAIGAGRAQVLRMIILEGLALTTAGLCLGIPIALGIARLMTSVLYGLSPADWVTFTVVPLAMLLMGAVAAWTPSRVASRVDPMIALRHD